MLTLLLHHTFDDLNQLRLVRVGRLGPRPSLSLPRVMVSLRSGRVDVLNRSLSVVDGATIQHRVMVPWKLGHLYFYVSANLSIIN